MAFYNAASQDYFLIGGINFLFFNEFIHKISVLTAFLSSIHGFMLIVLKDGEARLRGLPWHSILSSRNHFVKLQFSEVTKMCTLLL